MLSVPTPQIDLADGAAPLCVLTMALFDVFVLCVCVPVWARL